MKVEFVITAPEPISTILCDKADARQTVSVIIDIFLSAKKYIILGSPFLQDFIQVHRNLDIAIDTAMKRGVKLILISSKNNLQGMSTAKYGNNVTLYQPIDNVADNKTMGSHAKFCTADGELAYIGSANFTGPGFDKHIEMGVLGKADLAKKVELFWSLLSQEGFLVEVKN